MSDNYKKIKVAAYNSPKAESDVADFRCDGNADEIEINAASNLPRSTPLQLKFGNQQWFKTTSSQLTQSYLEIEASMESTFTFVTFNQDHLNVYSYEFSAILKGAGNAICNTLDALIGNSTFKPHKDYQFPEYQIFLTNTFPDIHSQVVIVRKFFPMVLFPFSALTSTKQLPLWWLAYNKVKRQEVFDCKQANLANSLASLAALAILGRNLGSFLSTKLFVNIGLTYPTNDPAINKDRILFNTF